MLIQSLHIYPIKSCAGTAVDSSTVLATGLRHDRRWMLVDQAGRFVTQREQPRLALIKPTLLAPNEPLSALRVHGPERESLLVEPGVQQRCTVTVWKDTLSAWDEGAMAATWFSDFLNMPVRLVRFDEAVQRFSAQAWTADVQAPNLFSDGFPMLLISQASLDDLNSRLTTPVPMNRFRPNIVVTGLGAYAEDTLGVVTSGTVRLRAVKPCTRCKVTTTDQTTGTVTSTEPLQTLMGYRRHRELRGVTFGQNVIVLDGMGNTLQVGQTLTSQS